MDLVQQMAARASRAPKAHSATRPRPYRKAWCPKSKMTIKEQLGQDGTWDAIM